LIDDYEKIKKKNIFNTKSENYNEILNERQNQNNLLDLFSFINRSKTRKIAENTERGNSKIDRLYSKGLIVFLLMVPLIF